MALFWHSRSIRVRREGVQRRTWAPMWLNISTKTQNGTSTSTTFYQHCLAPGSLQVRLVWVWYHSREQEGLSNDLNHVGLKDRGESKTRQYKNLTLSVWQDKPHTRRFLVASTNGDPTVTTQVMRKKDGICMPVVGLSLLFPNFAHYSIPNFSDFFPIIPTHLTYLIAQ